MIVIRFDSAAQCQGNETQAVILQFMSVHQNMYRACRQFAPLPFTANPSKLCRSIRLLISSVAASRESLPQTSPLAPIRAISTRPLQHDSRTTH